MIDPDSIPLSRFTGPLRYRVRLKDMGEKEAAAWERWLHAYITSLGADTCFRHETEANPTACTNWVMPPRERRILLAWLAEQHAIASVDVVRGVPGEALVLEVCNQRCNPSTETPT